MSRKIPVKTVTTLLTQGARSKSATCQIKAASWEKLLFVIVG